MSWLWVAAGVAAVVGGVSSLRSNQAQEAQLQAAAQANDYNAAVQRQRADAVGSSYNQREEQQRRKNRLEAGRRAAAIAQSGLGFEGSNAAIDEQSAMFAELDALNIRYEGHLESRGLLSQATQEDYYASSSRANARSVRGARTINAASAALSSGMSVYGMGR